MFGDGAREVDCESGQRLWVPSAIFQVAFEITTGDTRKGSQPRPREYLRGVLVS